MKKTIFALLVVVLGLSSCDLLDKTPKDKLVPENYFRNENDLKLFSNSFYENLFSRSAYEEETDVFFMRSTLSDELYGGTFRVVPTIAGKGGWSWGQLRKINTMLGNIHRCEDEAVRAQYTALARFFRAQFYFDKVVRFGDVPWYDKELSSTDPELYNPRDSRELIMSHMLEDIDFAIENLPSAVSTYRVNKYAALMLKARFCLFEGTFRKYHGEVEYEGGRSSDDYLALAAEAADEVMNGPYSLAPDYGTLFREKDADKNEYILAIKMNNEISCTHNATALAVMPSQGNPGFAKKFIDSFLMKDGTRFTDKEDWETMLFVDQVKDRDPRLGAIIRLPEHDRNGFAGPDISLTSTGYHFDKFVMDPTYELAERVGNSYNDLPVFRLGEAYLIYAEAKAELEDLDQAGLDKSVNKLRERAGMPFLNVGVELDPYLASDEYGYPNLAKKNPENLALLLEIRRERTIELCLEGFRWADIRRWKEGACYSQNLYGMYFPGVGPYDTTGDGKADIYIYDTANPPKAADGLTAIQIQEIEIDGKVVPLSNGIVLSEGRSGYVDMHKKKNRMFDEGRDYLYPIPTGDRLANKNLAQNPNWNDGLSF